MAAGHKNKQAQRSGMATLRFNRPCWNNSLSHFHPLTPLISIGKNHTRPKHRAARKRIKVSEYEFKSLWSSFPSPSCFQADVDMSSLGMHRRKDEMTTADIAPGEHKFFHRTERMHWRKSPQPPACLCHHPRWCSSSVTAGRAWNCPVPLLESSRAENSHTGICPELPNAHPELLQHQSLAERGKIQWAGSDKGGLGFGGYWCHTENLYHWSERHKNLSMTSGSYLTSAFCTICRAEIRMGGGCKNPKIKGDV